MVTFARTPGLVPQVASPLNPGARARLEPQIQSLYDHQLIIGTQSNPVNFFSQGWTNGRTPRETNAPVFPLPSPLVFLVAGFGVHLVQRPIPNAAMVITDVTDWNSLLYQGVLSFTVGMQGKGYLTGNLYQFPAGIGQYGFVTTGGATAGNIALIASNGVPAVGKYFRIKGAPITLTQNETFLAQIGFPASAVAMSNSHTVCIILRGVQGKQIG